MTAASVVYEVNISHYVDGDMPIMNTSKQKFQGHIYAFHEAMAENNMILIFCWGKYGLLNDKSVSYNLQS